MPQTMNFAEKIAGFVTENWPPSSWCEVHLAVAVSGGCDSMALLRVLGQLKQQHGGAGRLTALHVDHQLRGAESQADAQWCAQQCESLNIPLKILKASIPMEVLEPGNGIEAAARQQRYQLLATAAEEEGARYLAVAHTRDDQVETILFRILRGAGMKGLAGIPARRELTPAVTLVRPLLNCPREQLETYLEQLGQSYRTDSTNRNLRFTRNRIRHELLPQLRQHYNPDLDETLLRLAAQAESVYHFLEKQGSQLLERVRLIDSELVGDNAFVISCKDLAGQEPIVVCEALRLAWREAGLPEQDMTHPWWMRIAKLASDMQTNEKLNLPGGIHASVQEDRLVVG